MSRAERDAARNDPDDPADRCGRASEAMRILHLYKAYPPVTGGIENTVALLAEGQVAAGHQVTVVVSGPGARTQQETRNGVRVIRLGRLVELASTPMSPALPFVLARLRPDLAHVHSPFPPAELAQALVGRARRTVITWHSDVVRQRRILRLWAPVLRHVLSRVDRIFPTSQAYLSRSRFLQPVRERCQVIPLGLHLHRFLAPADSGRIESLRRAWSGPAQRTVPSRAPTAAGDEASDLPVVLFVGRLRAYKGLPYLLQAVRRLGVRCVIAGDGPERPHLEQLTRQLDLTARVHFAGHLPDPDLPAAYQAADLFVLPSHLPSEAFGLVAVEAMASGLPVVTTELGTGTSEVVRHGETGLVVPPADPDALASAIGRLLADPALRHRLGARGRTRARTHYAAEVYLARTEAAYKEVLAAPPRAPVAPSQP